MKPAGRKNQKNRVSAREKPSRSSTSHLGPRVREGLFILSLSLTLFFILALATFNPKDPAWSVSTDVNVIQNAAGPIGALCADVLLSFFGIFGYAFPVMLAFLAVYLFLHRFDAPEDTPPAWIGLRLAGFLMTLAAGCSLSHLYLSGFHWSYPAGPGGAMGALLSQVLLARLHVSGASLLLAGFLLMGVTFATGFSWLKLADTIGRFLLEKCQAWWANVKWPTWESRERSEPTERLQMSPVASPHKKSAIADRVVAARQEPPLSLASVSRRESKTRESADPLFGLGGALEDSSQNGWRKEPQAPAPALAPASAKASFSIEEQADPESPGSERPAKKVSSTARRTSGVLVTAPGLPSLSLLDRPPPVIEGAYSTEYLRDMSMQVEAKLADFGVQAQVVAVHPGPVVTRFELALAAGVKASKITGLARDLARSLAVVSVRVVEIIPGKPYVGLELPNRHREVVGLSELIASDAYQQATSPISLVLGKDIAGAPVVVDLAKMPHLLVAGTTGSGKSVGLNAMLLSLLFKASPEDVRLLLIDPKMLELAVYDAIPHLLAPVVTDVKEAGQALRWCVAEMERRYKLMAALGVRNLAGYNDMVLAAKAKGETLKDPLFESVDPANPVPELEKLPTIVVVIDEFADMMMVVGKKVESLIARIAQKARAAGIHLILATQRPSVDVITGLIKANIPTRIAFQVASRIDSRTILDQQGAEQLLGRGDMLYLPVGAGVPVRVHGAFVSDQEVHAVVEDWKKRGQPAYESSLFCDEFSGAGAGFAGLEGEDGEEDAEADPLYDQAVAAVLETRRASISMVQRRLKIGYNRAARLIEQMEASGLVSSMQMNGSREVLVPGNGGA